MHPNHPQNPTGSPDIRKTRRRRRRRRGRNALYPLRAAVVLVGGIGAAYLLFAFLNKAVHPYRLGFETRHQVRAARAELARQQAANEELRRRIAFLNSPEGAESQARRLGYYRKGETVFLLREEPDATATGAGAEVVEGRDTPAAEEPRP